MLPEQRGLLTSWFSSLRSKRKHSGKAARKRSQRGASFSRTRVIESLEDRRLLTGTVYVDFGTRLGSVSLPENTVGTTAGWNTWGFVPTGSGGGAGISWAFGPQFNYAGNPTITYTPLRDVFAAKQASEGFSFNLGQQPTNDPWQFQSGSQAPLSQLALLENSILQIIARTYAPFNISIVNSESTAVGGPGSYTNPALTPAGFLARNNPLFDPNTYDPTSMSPTINRGPNYVPPPMGVTDTSGFQDVYILIGGWNLNSQTGPQVGDPGQLGIFAAASTEQGGGALAPDPKYNSPGVMGRVVYSDGGGAVLADEIIDYVVAGQNNLGPPINANVAMATTASQAAAYTFGLNQTSDGEAKPWNKFFDTNIDLLTSSDVMRQGPFISNTFPTALNMPTFTNFDMMLGNFNDQFTNVQNEYTTLVNNPDFGSSGIAFVSGTGAYDKISLTPNANPDLVNVTVMPFSDASFSDDSFISTFNSNTNSFTSLANPYSYTIDISTGALLIEAGNNADQIFIDPTIFSAVLAAHPLTLTSLNVFVFGGEGLQGSEVDTIRMTSNGTQTINVTPSSTNPQAFNFATRFDTGVTIPTLVGALTRNTNISFFEFDDETTIRLEDFKTLNFNPPTFLFANTTISREHDQSMLIDGTAGPSPSGLLPAIGYANVAFIDTPNVNISIPVGVTNDTLTVNTVDPVDPTTTGFARGVVNFNVDLGPGNDTFIVNGPVDIPGGGIFYSGGSGFDTIEVSQDTNWSLSDNGLLNSQGGFVEFTTQVEAAIIDGLGDAHTYSIDDWSGDATLNIPGGGNTYNIGTSAAVPGNVTLNANGFIGDIYNIARFSGVGTFTGGSGDDVFNINTPTVTMSSQASGTGTSTAYLGGAVSVKTTSGSKVVKVVAGFGTFAIGQTVIGPNIPAGSTIVGISGTNLTLSAAATGTGTNNCVIGVIGGTGPRGIEQVSLATIAGKNTADVVGNFKIAAGQAIVGDPNIPANTNLIAISDLAIDAGDGNDTFYVKKWNGIGDLHGGAGNDNFFIGTLSTLSPSGDGVLQGITQAHNFIGDAGSDTLTLDDSGNLAAANYQVKDESAIVTDASTVFGGANFDITMENLKLIGSQGDNKFAITPDLKTAITVDGQAPTTSPGDILKVDLDGTKGPKYVQDVPGDNTSGTLSFTSGQKAIKFSHIETTQPDLTQVASAAAAAANANLLANLLEKMKHDPLLAVAGEAGSSGSPLVKVYDTHGGVNTLLFSFSAYELGFKGGVRATFVPDLNFDAVPDLVVAPGSGRLGEVKIYSGFMLAAGASTGGTHLVNNPDLALLSGTSLVPVNTTAGSNVATVGIIGQNVDGPNIAGGTTVSSINSTTTIGLSQAATGTGTVTATIGGNIVVSLKTTAGKFTATVASILNIGGLIVGQSVAGSNQVHVTATLGSKVLSVPTTAGLGLFLGEPVAANDKIPGNAIITAIGPNTITISAAAIDNGPTNVNFDPVASNTTVTAFKLTLGGITIALSNKVNSTGSLNSLFAAGFLPEAPTYKSGIYVAAGDLNGDGSIQLVTSRSSTVPNVEVFNTTDLLIGNTAPIAKFNPYTSKYLTGAQIAVGDVDGDTAAEIVTAPGSGQSPLVEVFNFDEVQSQLTNSLPVIPARSFLGFEAGFKNGVSLTVGDFDGPDVNGAVDQIALGAGTNGASRVRIFDEFGTQVVPEFKAFTTSANSPLRLTAINNPNPVDTDRRAVLFVGQANAARSHVIEEFKFTSAGLGLAIDGSFVDTLVETDPAMTNGVFLG